MVYVQQLVTPNQKIKRILGVPRKDVLKAISSHKWGKQISKEAVKTLACLRLMENVHMQVELCEIPLCRRSRSRDGSFRNPEERGVQRGTPQ